MEIDKKALGMRISNIRKARGLTLEEFGELVDGAGKSIVSKWERGLTIPNNARLKKIAELGNVPLDELMYGSLPTFILFNFKKLLPPRYKFLYNAAPVSSAEDIAYKIKEAKISVLEIEKIKLIIEEQIPYIISDFEKYSNRMLNFIFNHREYNNQIIEYFSSVISSFDKIGIEKLNYILNNANNLTLEEKCLFKGNIEDIHSYLTGVIHNEVYYTEREAFLIDENDLVTKLEKLNFKDNNQFQEHTVHYKYSYKPFPEKHEHYLLMVEVKEENIFNLISKGNHILIYYIPEISPEILSKYFINEKIVVIQNDSLYIGLLDESLVFKAIGEQINIDLRNTSIHNKVFPLVAIFY